MQYSSVLESFNLYDAFSDGVGETNVAEDTQADKVLILDPAEELLLECS